MVAKINVPTTYAEIRRAALEYHGSKGYPAYNRHYCAVNTAEFRYAILNGCDDRTAECIRKFLAGFRCFTGDCTKAGIQQFILQNSDGLKALATANIATVDLSVGSETAAAVSSKISGLMNIYGVKDVVASKILAIIIPDLFVMWDTTIWLAYRDDVSQNRHMAEVYVDFLRKMQRAAIAITKDAKTNHGIDSPAEHLSGELGLKPPFTLAKFIDEYNFIHTR